MNEQAYIRILEEELVAALGCTEPIALAYLGALAKEVLQTQPTSVHIAVSNNILKNVKGVIVPNTGGKKGVEVAVVAGIVAGDASKQLEVIAHLQQEQIASIEEGLKSLDITLCSLQSKNVLDMKVILKNDQDEVEVRIAHQHLNVVSIIRNGQEVFTKQTKVKQDIMNRDFLSVEGIYNFVECVDIQKIAPLLQKQIAYNSAIAKEGLAGNYGANVGSVLLESFGDAVHIKAKAYAAAASDARMSGCHLPVIINSGSGNQGISVSLPVIVYAEHLQVSEEKCIRALALSNLIAIHQKSKIGRLSAYCGVVSAGVGAGCGVAYLHDANVECLNDCITNAIMIVSGMVCDGAKASCAAKIASAVDAGLTGYAMAKQGQVFQAGDGLVGCCVETTIQNIGRLSNEGMRVTDQEIVDMMCKK